MARLKEKYRNEIAPALAKEFAIKNPLAVPTNQETRKQAGYFRKPEVEALGKEKELDLLLVQVVRERLQVTGTAVIGPEHEGLVIAARLFQVVVVVLAEFLRQLIGFFGRCL